MTAHTPINFDQSDTLVLYTTPELVEHPEKVRRCTYKDMRSPKTAGDILNTKKEVEELLYSIFPPRCWEEDGHLWQQTISLMSLTRQDVMSLQKVLDKRLELRQARETGICPIRRELYTQCFDEVIRQVTLIIPERGLLLLRIRDEANLSIEAYECLYSSAVDFGMHKAVQANEEKEVLRRRANILETRTEALKARITELQLKIEQSQLRSAEVLGNKQKRFAEELDSLQKANDQLKAQLDGITVPVKKF